MNTKELHALLTQIAQGQAALSARLDAIETQGQTPARKTAKVSAPALAPARKAAKKAADTDAKKAAYKAEKSTWNELIGTPYADIITLTAARIRANRKAGITNANIAPDDVRHHLVTRESRQLALATWKLEKDNPAYVSFAQVIADLNAALAKKAARTK